MTVDPTDADALCQALLTVSESEEARAELGRSGLQRAAEFSWKKCAEKTAQVYYAAVSERSGKTKERMLN
jgi:glycosyltransferase involved in cell wall biosynthesis